MSYNTYKVPAKNKVTDSKQMKVIIQIPAKESLKISYLEGLSLNYQMFTIKKFLNKLNKDEINVEDYKYVSVKVKI